MTRRTRISLLAALCALPAAARCADTDIEFIAEHVPEVAMDNRLASLPVWGSIGRPADGIRTEWQLGYSQTSTGLLKLAGPLFSVGLSRAVSDRWTLRAFGFFDRLDFSARAGERLMAPLFRSDIPLGLPANASFSGFGGAVEHLGAGLLIERRATLRGIGASSLSVGLLAQRMHLRDFRSDYLLLDGSSVGSRGTLDYSARYTFGTLLAGIATAPHDAGRWRWTPHALLAVPLPRRGVAGRISGPGFDLAGDTSRAGNGKHFGDPYVALGLVAEYRPLGLQVELGGLISQALFERWVHRGTERNWMLSISWSPQN